jgi:hypothetical protein
MPDKQTCESCKHWASDKVERKEFGLCEYPVPKWLQQAIGTARITHRNGVMECPVWVSKEFPALSGGWALNMPNTQSNESEKV